MLLGVLFQGPSFNSKYGKMKKKIGEKLGMVGDDVGGVVSGFRIHFDIQKV
jgi:hypothetical protein